MHFVKSSPTYAIRINISKSFCSLKTRIQAIFQEDIVWHLQYFEIILHVKSTVFEIEIIFALQFLSTAH